MCVLCGTQSQQQNNEMFAAEVRTGFCFYTKQRDENRAPEQHK